jgi:hypothetical protein
MRNNTLVSGRHKKRSNGPLLQWKESTVKKLFSVLVVLSLLWVVPAGAGPGDVTLGFKGGLNLANMGGDDISGTDSKTGFGGGGVLDYDFSNTFALQTEVLYMQKGFKEEEFGITAKFNLNYIEVPVLAKIIIGAKPGAKALPHILAGPAVAIEVGCNVSGELGGTSASIDCDDPGVGIKTKSVDVGAVFGAGIDILAGAKGKVTFDARYTLGLTNVIDETPTPSVKNQNISILVGYTVVLAQAAPSGE